ncbi:MAG: hypothetical protein C0490_24160 [Marivirga sp.]|nr:hypothetical protein [Marivirga sp.]
MGLKILKAFWFLSMLVLFANLLYVYASLPEKVVIQDENGEFASLGREIFFYIVTFLIALVNVLVYIVSFVFKKDIDFRAWFHGLILCVNIFFAISLNFIALFNSGERFDYGEIDFVIYGSIGLFVMWAIGWPFYLLYKKFSTKESI